MAVIGLNDIAVQGIGSALNADGGSVNINVALEYFTDKAKRNKWSKFKPVNINQPIIANITDTIGIPNTPINVGYRTVPWYFGELSQDGASVAGTVLYDICGIKVPVIQSVADSACVNIIKNYSTNGCNWEEVPIKDDYPRRLGDFRKYDTDAESPFYIWASPKVYYGSGESATFGISDNAESETQLSMEDISMVFDDTFERGVIITTTSGSVVGYYSSGESITNGGIGANWNANLSVGTYLAYFVARSYTHEKTIPYPSTSEYPNPVSIEVVNTFNPSTNPWNNLAYDLYGQCGFAYSNTSRYFEPFYNVGENDYTTLNTTGSFCFYIDIYANKTTYLNLGLIDFKWLWTGTSGDGGSPQHRTIINGTNYTNSGYTFEQGTTTRVYFQFDDIFYDSVSGTKYYPDEGDYFNIDAIEMNYQNSTLDYIYVDITYSVYHNGYFFNSADGYYQSK